ncbi:hypothetical protein [Paenibacillus naphthalenovorans]|uniref:hypothetical protein n=1 Tax=Paenibacillus naphthalenovorans TaxID=162209 RepID=UPI00119D9DD9|nr:hypothetical protein [Paenibacillus naphthalenovorans]
MDDHLWEQFAWPFLAQLVSHGSAVLASGTDRFGEVVASESKPSDRANHHDRELFGAARFREGLVVVGKC